MIFFFLILWFIFTGTFTAENLIFGAVVAAVSLGFACKYLNYGGRYEKILFGDIRPVKLLAVLVKEIFLANLQVVKWIYSPNAPNPCVVRFQTRLKSQLARVALADCITLTPGTITASLEDDVYIVHCLDDSMAEGLDQSVFVEALRDLEENQK